MKTPEIGDKVRLKQGTIEYVFRGCLHNGGSFHVGMEDGTQLTVFGCQIEEIIPKPWEPKVGDRIQMKGHNTLVIEYRGVFEGQVAYKFLVGGSITHLSGNNLSKFEPAPS